MVAVVTTLVFVLVNAVYAVWVIVPNNNCRTQPDDMFDAASCVANPPVKVVTPVTPRVPATVAFRLIAVTPPSESPRLMFVVEPAAPPVPMLIVFVSPLAVMPVPMLIV